MAAPIGLAQMSPDYPAAASRVRFIQHADQQVLLIDYSHCDVPMLKLVAEEGTFKSIGDMRRDEKSMRGDQGMCRKIVARGIAWKIGTTH